MSKSKREKQSAAPRIPTAEKLAQALEQAGAPADMTRRARAGYYDDYKGHSAFNIAELVNDARKEGLASIVTRAKAGEFDAQKWEADEWARSPEGRATFSEFFNGMRGKKHD